MAILFGGGRKVERDPLKAYCNEIRRNVREIERDLRRAKMQEAGLMRSLRRMQDIDQATKIAQEIVRLRSHVKKLDTMRTNMTSLSQQISEVKSTHRTHEMVAKMTGMMQKINKQFSMSGAQALVFAWDKANSEMDMKKEVLDEAMDSAFEVDREKEDTQDLVTGVLAEAGLDLSTLTTGVSIADLPLEERLNALKVSGT